MRIRTCDRYVVREMVGPFLVALFGLVLFIMLSLIINLSELVVDRGVSLGLLVRLLVLKLPSLVVLALPVSGLFAMFIGLGRLAHDREIIALEAAGISLRRVLLPLLLVSLVVAAADFALYNWGVPSSEHAFQRAYLSLIYRQGAPRLQSDTFFKGPEGEVLYARRYNQEDGSLSDVLVYDHVGKLFRLQDASVTIISAARGTWQGDAWALEDGRVYGVDDAGKLVHTATFESLTIPVEATPADFFVQSRQPTEMGITELAQRISLLRSRGLPADRLILECHRKVAIPLATLVFVLLGGSISLIFGWRSRAAGIVLSFLLVGAYQGVFLWMGTLGERGIIPAAAAAWLPNIIFGSMGAALFVRLDRLSSRDLWGRVRRAIPFIGGVVALLVGPIAFCDELPVTVESDELHVSADGTHVRASGGVRLAYEEIIVLADVVTLDRGDDGNWTLVASGEVLVEVGDEVSLAGARIDVRLEEAGGALATRDISAERFRGRSRFVNSLGEEQVIVFEGAAGTVAFGSEGEAATIELEEATLTTCDCCAGDPAAQPYVLEAGRMRLLPDRLVVAFDLTIRIYGVGVFWLPVYVQPLEEALESPLFPAIGRSDLRGWFLKWNLPFFLGERTYGSLLFDAFSRFVEFGLGADVRYGVGRHSGRARVYAFPAKVGERLYQVSIAHDVALGGEWTVGGEAAYEQRGDAEELAYAVDAAGLSGPWAVSLAARREREEDEASIRYTERAPELALTGAGIELRGWKLVPRLTAGQYREWTAGEEIPEAVFRGSGGLTAAAVPLELGGLVVERTVTVEASRYLTSDTSNDRLAGTVEVVAEWARGRVSYELARATSTSPLLLDLREPVHRVAWELFAEGGWRAELGGGLDLDAGALAPIEFDVHRVGERGPGVTGSYDLSMAALTHLRFSYGWIRDAEEVRVALPVDLLSHETGPLEWEARSVIAGGEATVSGAIDLATGTPERLLAALHLAAGERLLVDASAQSTGDAWETRASIEWLVGDAWGLVAGASWRSGASGVLLPRAGVFRDLEGCLRVGVELEGRQIWVYASVLAFPEAILRYSPSGAMVRVGR